MGKYGNMENQNHLRGLFIDDAHIYTIASDLCGVYLTPRQLEWAPSPGWINDSHDN